MRIRTLQILLFVVGASSYSRAETTAKVTESQEKFNCDPHSRAPFSRSLQTFLNKETRSRRNVPTSTFSPGSQKQHHQARFFQDSSYKNDDSHSSIAEEQDSWNHTVSSSTSELESENSTLSLFYRRYDVESWKVFGLFDESYLREIDEHWLTFPPASNASYRTMAITYLIVMTVGCGGNLLVIIMFFRCRSLRTPANYLILNLAVSDFIMLAKMPVFIVNSWYGGPVLGSMGCQVFGFLGGLTGTTSIMTLAAIAVDRYCVIVFPLNPYKRTTHTRAILMIFFAWIYSAVFSTMPLLGINHYVSEGFLTSCSFDYLKDDVGSRIFIFVFFVAAWVCPLSFIVFSYFAIFRMVMQAEKLDFFNGDKTRESFKSKRMQDKLRKDVKIAMLTTFIILIWILAWTPYATVALLGIFGQKHLITPLVSAIPGLFCKISSCINPFVYSINHPRFQKELRSKCQSICKCRSRAALRKSSPQSVSYGVSVSDNYEFQTRRFNYDSESVTIAEEGGAVNQTVELEKATQLHQTVLSFQEDAKKTNGKVRMVSIQKPSSNIAKIGPESNPGRTQKTTMATPTRYVLLQQPVRPVPPLELSNSSRRRSEPNLIWPIIATCRDPASSLSRCKSVT